MNSTSPQTPSVRVAAAQPVPARSRWINHLAWLPMILLIIIALTTVAGVRAVPWATAASIGSNQIVNGNIGVVVWIDTTTGCPDTTIPNLSPGDRGIHGTVCTVQFGTNGPLGADLNVRDANAVGDDTMRCIATCTAASIHEDTAGALPAAPATGALPALSSNDSWFAMSLDAISGPVTVADMTVNGAGGGIAGANWADVPDAAFTACHTTLNTTAVTDGLCDFYWAVETLGNQSAGSYRADIEFQASER